MLKKKKDVEFYILDFSKTISNVFYMSEMCILGELIDVENVKAICKKKKKKISRVISLSKTVYVYI